MGQKKQAITGHNGHNVCAIATVSVAGEIVLSLDIAQYTSIYNKWENLYCSPYFIVEVVRPFWERHGLVLIQNVMAVMARYGLFFLTYNALNPLHRPLYNHRYDRYG